MGSGARWHTTNSLMALWALWSTSRIMINSLMSFALNGAAPRRDNAVGASRSLGICAGGAVQYDSGIARRLCLC